MKETLGLQQFWRSPSWAFSIVLADGGNKSDTSYLVWRLDSRRFQVVVVVCCCQSCICFQWSQCKTVTLMNTCTTGYDLASSATAHDNLALDWRSQIISVISDGSSSMAGQYRGILASQFGNTALPHVWLVCIAPAWSCVVAATLQLFVWWLICHHCNIYDSRSSPATALQPDCRDGIEVSRMCQHLLDVNEQSHQWAVSNRVDIVYAANLLLATKTVNCSAPTNI